MKPKLIVLELWGIGDLAIATPFLKAASKKYEVTLLAKPFALELQKRFWPEVSVIPFSAPWTEFTGKYRFLSWPWLRIFRLWRDLSSQRFQVGVSGRWDPRDHFLLWSFGAERRFGFSRLHSQSFLTQPLPLPERTAHRYQSWRELGKALGLELPPKEDLNFERLREGEKILVHSGAGQAVRVWPLVRFKKIVERLRASGHPVQVACDADQKQSWLDLGEKTVVAPKTIAELLQIIDDSTLFIGNDSGPGHLAAKCGCPTFTIMGAQLPEWFAPLHPRGDFIEGKACPYKPCFDYCRFPAPHCLLNVSEAEVWVRVKAFVESRLVESKLLAAT